MKAAILNKFDKNGTKLSITDVDIPNMNADDVLVKIKYAAVNPLDNMIIRKEVHLITPYNLPLIMGNEFSGVVEDVGSNVNDFNVGDKVYCRMPLDNIGAFAEYAVVKSGALAKIPEGYDFKEAACIPLTALTAIQAFDLMKPKAGESLFISGGTGSLGAMAIPIAKSLGLKVITSGSMANKSRVEKLGVDTFIDYKTQDILNCCQMLIMY